MKSAGSCRRSHDSLSLSQEAICEHDIRNINWACQDAEDLTHLAYITKDLQSEKDLHHCHVFQVSTMVSCSLFFNASIIRQTAACATSQDLATEIILTLGQAFEVAYQLVLREGDLFGATGLPSQPVPSNGGAPSHPKPDAAEPSSQKPPEANPTPAPRKLGPKPTVLPKPKLGTAVLGQQKSVGGKNLSHSRSHTSVDTLPERSMHDARLQSDSNLVGLSKPAPRGVSTSASAASVASSGSGRAPLAAKDEL